MKDANICEHCNLYLPVRNQWCPNCKQPLALPARKSISIWRLGDIRDGVLGHVAAGLAKAFKTDAVIQPAFLDERPSIRPHWNGISATVFLNQVYARRANSFISLGVTERNMVPDAMHNFLFGYAFLGLRAAVVGLDPLCTDDPDEETLAERVLKIAVHEVGHTLGLDHHTYEEEVDCVMVGDEDQDCLDQVDAGSASFCRACSRSIAARLRSRK